MIYALALGSNQDPEQALAEAKAHLAMLGRCEYSPLFELPDRDGGGQMYINLAILLFCPPMDLSLLQARLQQIEIDCGRVWQSKIVRLDIDLIAYGETVAQLQVISRRLPLPLDVSLPLRHLWPACPS